MTGLLHGVAVVDIESCIGNINMQLWYKTNI